MRLPRLTTRRLMVIVAVVAFGIEGWRLFQWSRIYQDWAKYHSNCGMIAQAMRDRFVVRADMLDSNAAQAANDDPAQADLQGSRAENYRRLAADLRSAAILVGKVAERHFRLKAKYLRAARYPWLPVQHDPPEPAPPK